MTTTVAVLGGGVGGLSAAHELTERGFDVSVYEANDRFGGKARSIPVTDDGEKPLLGEHGFRFFPGFYRHITDTMRRIPYGTNPNGVADNLRPTTESLVATTTERQIASTQTPSTISEWIETLRPGRTADTLSDHEARHFVRKMVQFLTSCETRRRRELDTVSWWEYIDAERMSDAYQQQLGNSTQLLVALRPHDGSARTICAIYVQLLRGRLDPSIDAERVLNGPTSTVWIDPWTNYLDRLGVELHTNTTVEQIHCDARRQQITHITLHDSDTKTDRDVEADYYVAALPVETMTRLLTPALCRAAPSLARIDRLRTGWMSGIQFYLAQDIPFVHGHQMYFDAPWALTAISQQQFWDEYALSECGDRDVAGVLSVIISNWNANGIIYEKPARECLPTEIKDEVWAQLQSVETADDVRLSDDNLVRWFLNPAIEETADGVQNCEPLLVNTTGSFRNRPDAATEIDSLVLASDYVRTNTDLASMEGANEAARRAVNAIIERSRQQTETCQVWELEEPTPFKPLKAHDAVQYRLGLPHVGDVVECLL